MGEHARSAPQQTRASSVPRETAPAGAGVGNAERQERMRSGRRGRSGSNADRQAPGPPATPPTTPAASPVARIAHQMRILEATVDTMYDRHGTLFAEEDRSVPGVATLTQTVGVIQNRIARAAAAVTGSEAPAVATYLPPLEIWVPVFLAIENANASIATGDLAASTQTFEEARDEALVAGEQLQRGIRAIDHGSEWAISGMRTLRALGVLAAGAYVGAGAAMGLAGTAVMSGGAAVGARALQGGVAAGSAALNGNLDDDEHDPRRNLRESLMAGVSMAMGTLFGGFFAGQLARAILGRVGGQLTAAQAQLLLSDSEAILAELGASIPTTAVTVILERHAARLGRRPDEVVNEVALIDEIAAAVTHGGIITVLLGLLTHRPVGGPRFAGEAEAAHARTSNPHAAPGVQVRPAEQRPVLESTLAHTPTIRGAGQREAHLADVRRLQSEVIDAQHIPGVPRDLQVVPDWTPDPLPRNQVRVTAVRRVLQMHNQLRGHGADAEWAEMMRGGTLAGQVGNGSFTRGDQVNIDPHGSDFDRAATAMHEGEHHDAFVRRGRRPHRSADEDHHVQMMWIEEARAEGRAIRFRADAGRVPAPGSLDERYWRIYHQGIRAGMRPEAAHAHARRYLEEIWPQLRISGAGHPTYDDAYRRAYRNRAPAAAAAPAGRAEGAPADGNRGAPSE